MSMPTERDANHRGQLFSRRGLVAATGGLLVPVAGILLPEDAGAKKGHRRKHRRRNRPNGIFADDVLLNIINQSGTEFVVHFKVSSQLSPGLTLKDGAESGWNAGITPSKFGWEMRAAFHITNSTMWQHRFSVRVENPEVGKPWGAVFENIDQERAGTVIKEYFDEGEMNHGSFKNLKFTLHRWDDGNETFDDDTEEYCRFVCRVHQG